MKYRISILPAAELDIWQAALFYENLKPELGLEFLDELESAKTKLGTNPQYYAYLSSAKTLRRFSLNRFPYKVIFEILDDHVVIYAVHHDKRKLFP